MPADQIGFKFKLGYDGESAWTIERWGHPDHGKEIRIKWTAYPLYQFGRRRYNYTVKEYMTQVVANLRYMRFGCSSPTQPDMDYVHAFNRMLREQHARTLAKYPDYAPEPLELVRGIVWLERTPDGQYSWRKARAQV